MAQVTVSDYALWIKHIHGDDDLRRRLDGLAPDATVRLRVAGEEGVWRKMSAYKTTGKPTPGLAPLGPAQARWKELYRTHKARGGAVVEIELVPDAARRGAALEVDEDPSSKWERAPEAERAAAWEAFKALMHAGWRSEEPYGSRDELYDRDER